MLPLARPERRRRLEATRLVLSCERDAKLLEEGQLAASCHIPAKFSDLR